MLTKTAIKADKYWEPEKAGTGLSLPAGRHAEQYRHPGNRVHEKTTQPPNLSTMTNQSTDQPTNQS